MAQQIKEGIFWIGVDNPKGRDFHGIRTPRGGSYNSYLIKDEQPAIVEGVNKPFFEKYIRSLKQEIDPKEIKFIIINHAEPDHTGALNELLKECPIAKIVCTAKCKEFLDIMYDHGKEYVIVKEYDELSLGNKTLQFFTDPMVHWPETMFTYLKEDKVLFPADLFSTEIAHEKTFADEMEDFSELTLHYFALVMRPFHKAVKSAIDKVKKLEIEYICPSHGPSYRNDTSIIDLYKKLSTEPEEDKVTIIDYSIWHGSENMAKKIKEKLEAKGKQVNYYEIRKANLVELMAQSLTSKTIIFGSMTIANSYHPLFETLFAFLKLNNQKGKKALVFGTYGWAPASVPKLKARCEELGYEVIGELDFRFGKGDGIDEFVEKIN